MIAYVLVAVVVVVVVGVALSVRILKQYERGAVPVGGGEGRRAWDQD
jgi:regulator of protease activity HflC (stomatin/prohibitin superfamily)